MTDPPDSTSPFTFELSSATIAYDGTIVIALHRGESVQLLKGSAEAACKLAIDIIAEIAWLDDQRERNEAPAEPEKSREISRVRRNARKPPTAEQKRHAPPGSPGQQRETEDQIKTWVARQHRIRAWVARQRAACLSRSIDQGGASSSRPDVIERRVPRLPRDPVLVELAAEADRSVLNELLRWAAVFPRAPQAAKTSTRSMPRPRGIWGERAHMGLFDRLAEPKR